MSLRTQFLRLLIVVVCLVTPLRSAHAQVDPRGDIRTLSTRHFRVHVRAGHEDIGRRSAALAEQAYAQLSAELSPPAGIIDLHIADNLDFSNGYAQSFPTNRVVIYDVPPVGSTELRFHDDWLRLVITHELAHIFHLDRARGVWRVGRWVFGRNPLFFPNAYVPSWVKEGLAVHYESALTGSGRLVSTESRTVLRSAARDDMLPPLHRWSLSTSQFPNGQIAYSYGMQLMDHAAHVGGDSSMRKFVETVAVFPIPFLLGRASGAAFGTSFAKQFAGMRDSLRTLVSAMDTSGDVAWRAITHDGWYAESPRWRSADTVMWVATNGRDVTGVFETAVNANGAATRGSPRRIARRNGLDVNVPTSGDSTVFAQLDYRNPYEVRSDLYRGQDDDEVRITHGARLSQPDVRRDGAIVAIQLAADAAHLVRVSRSGVATPLRTDHTWAEPRWSPDGASVVAVQFLPTGEERIVVLDTLGVLQQVITGARAVFASPSFTPDGRRLVWSSDRSGRMQLETAPVATGPDTLSWRASDATTRGNVREASRVSTGVYQPSVSPDGRWVAALVYRGDGSYVSVAPLDTTGAIVRGDWYAPVNRVRSASDSVVPAAGAYTGYRVIRQLLPSYWLPQIGTGRLAQSTYGASTSGTDILGRHEWSVSALGDPSRGETDASATYRYRGLGVPVLDASWSQQWDGTFRVTDSSGVNTLGFIARRRRFSTLATSWSVPRVRQTVTATVGAQYEWRDFLSDNDALLGPADGLLRRGTRYPSVFANTSFNTARRGARGISIEEGVLLSTGSSYRWRDDAPGTTGAWRHSGTLRAYLPIDLPGFSRHALMTRVSAARTGINSSTELSVGGVSGVSSELIPGVVVGDPGRTFPVRGVAPGVQRGTRALGGSVEYRAPLVLFRRAPGPFTLFLDRMSFTMFSDAARAWCSGADAARANGLCERPGARDGWLASAGAELVIDLAVQYDVPARLRIGAAAPYAAPVGVSRRGAFYVTLGSLF